MEASKYSAVEVLRNGEVVHTERPGKAEARFTWEDRNPLGGEKASYYYVRGEQVPDMEGATGENVWASPMWIAFTGK